MTTDGDRSADSVVSDHEVLTLWRALERGELTGPWSRAFGAALTREDFLAEHVPEGVSDEAAWDFFRRTTGIAKVQMSPRNRAGAAYAFTPRLVEVLHDIDTQGFCSIDDSLGGTRDTRARFVARALMEEAIESALPSASSMSRADAATFLNECLDPRTRDELSLANRHAVFSGLDAYAGHRFTPELITELYLDLTQGLRADGDDGLFRTETEWPASPFLSWNLGPPPPPEQIGLELRALCDLLEERPPYDNLGHPLVTGLLSYFWLTNLQPFRLSDVGLSRAIAGLYLYQHGYRTLHLLPLSALLRTSMDSFRGELAGPQTPFPDITRFLVFQFERIRDGLDDLWERVAARAEEERALEARMRHRMDLSRRQRALVARALDEPGATFSVKSHQREYSLSRSTAFRDLQALVDRGYFVQHRVGHAWEYSAVPGIREKAGGA